MDHVAKLLPIPFEGQDHPVLEQLGDTADALGKQLPDDVRLLELVVRSIQHNCQAFVRSEAERTYQFTKGIFGFVCTKLCDVIERIVEVNVEVRRRNVSPLEGLVLHLVLAKLHRCKLPLGRRSNDNRPENKSRQSGKRPSTTDVGASSYRHGQHLRIASVHRVQTRVRHNNGPAITPLCNNTAHVGLGTSLRHQRWQRNDIAEGNVYCGG
ncbi:hypothetical protein HRbin20_01168 [bacterium HR20]|nr:hypothetical protein HRbin20_01168 [bacterium HR20]